MELMDFIKDVLARLHAGGFPEALVAGGALRDIDNHRAELVKDIDVFVEDRPCYLDLLSKALYGLKHKMVFPDYAAQGGAFEGVMAVHEFHDPFCPAPVQVVVMNRKVTPDSVIERHDFGICQICTDGVTEHMTAAYMRDRYNQTFTLVRCRDARDKERSLKRWDRLNRKYQGWTLVLP